MHLIVGLGNPGRQYEHSRHNLGVRVIDDLAKRWKTSFQPGRGEYWSCQAEFRNTPAVLLRPTTYMNDSGRAVADAASVFGIPAENIVVIYDDLQIPLGSLRIRPRGSDGGHNGMYSVIMSLGTDEIPRLRCGIGTPTAPTDPSLWRGFVLSVFNPDEIAVVDEMIRRASEAVEAMLAEGIDKAMNTYNRVTTQE